eukprot:15458697-Alexandrium_andersonii.AAC.1
MMVPEPPDAGDGLVDRAIAQAAFAQRWVRQDRARIANHKDECLVAGVRGEAIVHCDLRRIMCTNG